MAEKVSSDTEHKVNKANNKLICKGCSKFYKIQKLLNCFHALCRDCIEKRASPKKRAITCVECNQVTTLPPNGANGLQDAFHIKYYFNIKETLKKINNPQNTCEKCSESSLAVMFCRRCGSICEACNDAHLKLASEDHQVLKIEEAREELTNGKLPQSITHFCLQHPKKEIDICCLDCKKTMCSDCAFFTQHDKAHTMSKTTDLVESYKKDLEEITLPIEEHIQDIQDALLSINDRYDAITTRKDDMIDKLQCVADKCIQAIRESQRDLEEKLKQDAEEQQTKLTKQKATIEHSLAQRIGCKEFIHDTIKTGTPEEVINVKESVLTQVEDQRKKFDRLNLEPCQVADADFNFTPEHDKQCGNIGELMPGGTHKYRSTSGNRQKEKKVEKVKEYPQPEDTSVKINSEDPISLLSLLEMTVDAQVNWHSFGLVLEINPDDLDAIQKDNPSNTKKCLTDMLTKCLNQHPELNWLTVYKALMNPLVGRKDVAMKIKDKYLQDEGGSRLGKREHPKEEEIDRQDFDSSKRRRQSRHPPREK